MPSQWLKNLSLSGWNFSGVNRNQSRFCCCCCHFCCKENICLDDLFLFWRSEMQNQSLWNKGTVPASPADCAARMQHHDSVVASVLSLGIVITPSDRDGTELHSSTALYYMCTFLASRSDVQHPWQQPHHGSTTFVTLTNELHTQNCSHTLPSDSISPLLAMAKRKIAFNTSKLLLLLKGLW